MPIRKLIPPEELAKRIAEVRPLAEGLSHVIDHVAITDVDGNIIYMNKGAEENTGFSYQEAIGRNPGDMWGGQMDNVLYEKMWKTIKEEKKAFIGEVKNIRKDGSEYWQEVRICPILDEKGNIRFFLGVEPNITSRKKAEKEREEYYAELKKLYGFMVDREVKMTELKTELDRIKEAYADITKYTRPVF